jgi:RND family efflux transporter MFP subunit
MENLSITMKKNKLIKGMLTILPVAAAVLAVGYLMTHRSGPSKNMEKESVTSLRIINVPSVELVPRVIGFGVAQPGNVWEAIAQVQGTVLSIYPRLKSGEMIRKDTLLIQIDPREYQLAIARLEAGIEETKAKLQELAGTGENTERLMKIEQASLALAEKSFDRNRQLLKQNAASRDMVDREQRTLLQQQQAVQLLKNSLALIPSKRKALKSILALQQASLEQAGIDLNKTAIKAPMDCRLGEVNMDSGQFVRSGQLLFKAHSTQVTEIEARFPMDTFRNLVDEETSSLLKPGVNPDTFKNLFQNMSVQVSLQSGDWSAQWDARIDRWRETLDHKTREIRVVVAIDRPYEQAVPGIRPPITQGMFCRVELQGPVRRGRLVIPRSAVHNTHVFVVDPENRLEKKEIQIDFIQSEFVVIKSGLFEGERLVVSDPAPAIMGMKVSPVTDAPLEQYLKAGSQAEEEQ